MPDLRIGQADCVNFLVVRLYSGEARCHHPGNVEDRCPGYHRLQLIVNLQLSQDKTLKKKKKRRAMKDHKVSVMQHPVPHSGT